MFVKIKEGVYVNLEQVKSIELVKYADGFFWFFWLDMGDEEYGLRGEFQTKKEAVEWFQDNIKPVLRDYNNAKNAPFEIATFLDQIVIPLQKLVKQEV